MKNVCLLILVILNLVSKYNTQEFKEIKVLYDETNKVIIYNNEVYTNFKGLNFLENNNTSIPDHPESSAVPESPGGLGSRTINIIIVAVLTSFSGIMSGLTIGYLSIDDLVLELKSNTGTDEERGYAEKVLPIISKRHWLLCTLLLCNATAAEALPIFLNRLVDEYAAIAMSVTLVLVFGEILPQAICTGSNQIKIAAFLAPMTMGLMYITYPIAYPIALLLDWLLGTHTKSRFVNTELKSLIELHTLDALSKLNMCPPHHHQYEEEKDDCLGLHHEQANLMISALEINQKKAIEMMIPMNKVFMVDYDEPIDTHKLNQILSKGYSRIPVFQKGNGNDILGILRIKQLIGIDFSQTTTLRKLDFKLKAPLIINPATPAIDLLREFKKGQSHMAFITEQVNAYRRQLSTGGHVVESVDDGSFLKSRLYADRSGVENKEPVNILGIVTLEDVLEEMINIEIMDEDDYAKTKVKNPLNPRLFSKIFN
jgi:metal transporter CNNM